MLFIRLVVLYAGSLGSYGMHWLLVEFRMFYGV